MVSSVPLISVLTKVSAVWSIFTLADADVNNVTIAEVQSTARFTVTVPLVVVAVATEDEPTTPAITTVEVT